MSLEASRMIDFLMRGSCCPALQVKKKQSKLCLKIEVNLGFKVLWLYFSLLLKLKVLLNPFPILVIFYQILRKKKISICRKTSVGDKPFENFGFDFLAGQYSNDNL